MDMKQRTLMLFMEGLNIISNNISTAGNSSQMSNRPSCVNLKRMKFSNPIPSSEVSATKGLLLMAAGRYLQCSRRTTNEILTQNNNYKLWDYIK